MTPFRLVSVALVLAMSLASGTAPAEASVHISQNAMARNHAAMMEKRYAAGYDKRAITFDGAKRMAVRRATAEQLAYVEKFHKQNAEWQQAAIQDLKDGKTPKTFDEYWGTQTDSSTDTPAETGSQQAPETEYESESEPKASKPVQEYTQQHATKNQDDVPKTQEQQQSKPKQEEQSKPQQQQQQQQQQQESKPKQEQPKPKENIVDTVSGLLTGQGTYYDPGLGACGYTNAESDRIVAISHELFDSFGTGNPNNNPVCGHKIKATYNGKTTVATVVDRCEGCAYGDLDFTRTGFQDLASLDLGRLSGLKWSWVGSAPKA